MNRRRPAIRLGVAAAALASLGAIGLVSAAPVSAGILPTSTTVTATPDTFSGRNVVVTLKATTGPLGLLITPGGSIDFKVFFPGAPSGAAGVYRSISVSSPCLVILIPCTASTTISVPGASPGIYSVVASYKGDTLSNPSTGSTTFTVAP